MDESKLVFDIWQKYGVNGVLTVLSLIVFWKHYLEPKKEDRVVRQKKAAGTYVSWESLSKRIEKVEIAQLEHIKSDDKQFAQLETMKEIQLLKNDHISETFARIEKNQDEMKETQQKTFDMIAGLKNVIIKVLAQSLTKQDIVKFTED